MPADCYDGLRWRVARFKHVWRKHAHCVGALPWQPRHRCCAAARARLERSVPHRRHAKGECRHCTRDRFNQKRMLFLEWLFQILELGCTSTSAFNVNTTDDTCIKIALLSNESPVAESKRSRRRRWARARREVRCVADTLRERQ